MKKGEKAVIAVAVSGIVVAAIAMAVSGSKAKAAGGGGNNGGISIILYDQNGNIIGSAAELAVPGAYGAVVSSATEGDTISMVIGATNTSYQEIGGVNTPIAAALTLKISGSAGVIALIPVTSKVYNFGAGQSLPIDKSSWGALQFIIPVGTGGMTGTITVSLLDPVGNTLASGQASLPINHAPIIYGGTVNFT
jgi:hypothetical protein